MSAHGVWRLPDHDLFLQIAHGLPKALQRVALPILCFCEPPFQLFLVQEPGEGKGRLDDAVLMRALGCVRAVGIEQAATVWTQRATLEPATHGP